jgi:hypothetical protein
MRISAGHLRKLIQETLGGDEITLSDGTITTYASEDHLRDMQAILAGLESLKRQHKYGSAARSRFAEASAQLKNQLKKAQMSAESIKVDVGTKPDRTFSQLEGDGASGYGTGESPQGKFIPGRNK